MKIDRLQIKNFKAMEYVDLNLRGKSTVFFGINGTGKSSVLKTINLLYAGIINHVVNRRELRQNYTLQLEDIQYGKSETQIKADFEINKNIISYYRKMIRKSGKGCIILKV